MSERALTVGIGAVVTACDILEAIGTNAELESLIIEVGLFDFGLSRGSISKTLLAVKEFSASNPDFLVRTEYGETHLSVFMVEEAIRRFGSTAGDADVWDKLERYLNLDGFALQRGKDKYGYAIIEGLAVAMPQSVGIAKAQNEIDALLERYSFNVAQRHLESAKRNIAQADWEAANGQCRTFLDALTDGIADGLFPVEAKALNSGLQKRQLLANNGFLSRDKHEFGDGPAQTYLPGLVKLLHPDGAHPGISSLDDALFRLQAVIVTARWLLKRFEHKKSES